MIERFNKFLETMLLLGELSLVGIMIMFVWKLYGMFFAQLPGAH